MILCILHHHISTYFFFYQRTNKPVSGPGDIIDVKIPDKRVPVDSVVITVTRNRPGSPNVPDVTTAEVVIKGCVKRKFLEKYFNYFRLIT